jgi:hypothetical protein
MPLSSVESFVLSIEMSFLSGIECLCIARLAGMGERIAELLYAITGWLPSAKSLRQRLQALLRSVLKSWPRLLMNQDSDDTNQFIKNKRFVKYSIGAGFCSLFRSDTAVCGKYDDGDGGGLRVIA